MYNATRRVLHRNLVLPTTKMPRIKLSHSFFSLNSSYENIEKGIKICYHKALSKREFAIRGSKNDWEKQKQPSVAELKADGW